MFEQRGELPPLPFGDPIGFAPASRGVVYIESIKFEAFLAIIHGAMAPDTSIAD